MSSVSVLRDSYTCRISDMVKTIIWSLTDSISEYFLNPWEIVIMCYVSNQSQHVCGFYNLIYGWDRTSAYIGATGSRYPSICNLTQHINERFLLIFLSLYKLETGLDVFWSKQWEVSWKAKEKSTFHCSSNNSNNRFLTLKEFCGKFKVN